MSHPHQFDSEHLQSAPIDVRIVGTETTQEEAPELSSWQSYVFDPTGGNVPVAIRILPLNPKRARAVIMVGPGVAGNAAGFVLLGSETKVKNGAGGRLASGQSAEVKGRPAVWAAWDGANSLTVTVIEEGNP